MAKPLIDKQDEIEINISIRASKNCMPEYVKIGKPKETDSFTILYKWVKKIIARLFQGGEKSD